MRLVIGWATPWNVNSAIAKMSLDVTSALAAMGHHVEIIMTEVGEAAALPLRRSALTVRSLETIGYDELNARFDVVFVNIGNYFAFHGAALELMRHVHATVAIMHDAWMGDFLADWRRSMPEQNEAIDAWMACFPPGPPLLGPLLSLAAGAIVHGPHYLEQANRYCAGPVELLPLAYTAPLLAPPRPSDRLRIATVGHVNPNKRVDEVIRAIGSSQLLRERVDYTLLGPVEPHEKSRLLRLAESLKVRLPNFTGWLDDDQLSTAMAEMDVFCCLRYPVTEGGSASLVTAMMAGRPTLVSDHASYGEVPDDTVLKCPPGREAAAVARHLERLIADPSLRQATADRATRFAQVTNCPAAYASRVVALAHQVARGVPNFRTALHLGRTLGEMGVAPDDPAIRRAAMTLAECDEE